MKKRLLTFTLILVSIFVFSCAEEVIPDQSLLDDTTEKVLIEDNNGSETDDEEEDNGMKPPVG